MSEIDPSQLEGDMIPQGKYKPARELKELHEDSDLDVRGVLFNTAVLMALCVATFFAVGLVMGRFKAEEEEMDKLALSNRFNADPTPPAPVLQPDPAGETRAVVDAAKARLETYGWNDAEKKSAHIPIERAMAILAERGLPDVGKVDEFHPAPGSSGLPKIGVPGEAAPAAEPKAEEPAKSAETPKAEAKP
jgi:hypothetical protein